MSVKRENINGIGWITLDRPDVRNALSGELMEGVGEPEFEFLERGG